MNRDHNTVYIADGFADDCEELIHRCSRAQPLTYCVFAEIWKDMDMASIYKDRSSGAEIAELSEEVIHVAKHYMLSDTSNYEESVAGLFLVYALLNLQPFQGFAWLRLVPDDVAAVRRIEIVARRERRFDVLRVLGDVLIRGTQYHATARERGIEPGLRKYFGGTTSIDRWGMRPKGVFQRQNEELDLIRELGTLSRLYTEAKAHCGGTRDRNLRYADQALGAELDSSLRALINGLPDDDKTANHSDSVQTIKARAMRTAVSGVGHLTGVKEKAQLSPKKTPRPPAALKNSTKPTLCTEKTNLPDSTCLVPRSPRKTTYAKSKAYLQEKKSDEHTYEVPIVENEIFDMPAFPEETLKANATKRKRRRKNTVCQYTEDIDYNAADKNIEIEVSGAGNGSIGALPSIDDSDSNEELDIRHVSPKETVKNSSPKKTIRNSSPKKLVTLKRIPKTQTVSNKTKRPVTSRKRKSPLKKNSKIKRRKSYTSSSESDSEIVMEFQDSDDDAYSVTDDIENAIEIEVESEHAHIIDKTSPKTQEIATDTEPNDLTSIVDDADTSTVDSEIINEKINEGIEIGKPIIIEAENGSQIIEIEIIDYMQTDPNGKTRRNTRNENKNSIVSKKPIEEPDTRNKKPRKTKGKKDIANGFSLPDDVSIKKVRIASAKRSSNTLSPRRSPRSQTMATITKINPVNENGGTEIQNGGRTIRRPTKTVLKRLKEQEKCDIKNSKVKSTLRRMGILPVANFNETK